MVIACVPSAGLLKAQAIQPKTPSDQQAPAKREKPLQVGDTAPNFRLQDQKGAERSLEELLKRHDRVALVFYRSADW